MQVPSSPMDRKIGKRILCTSQIRLAGEGSPVCSADADVTRGGSAVGAHHDRIAAT
jgi:hypothetical protein